MMIPPIIPLAIIMCGSAVLITAMGIVSRHISQRRMSSQSFSNEELARRLDRIEQAVESTAIEVERISESGRFVAKLLAERKEPPPAS